MSAVKAIVTDIEGTTSSIAFVREVLFPHAREALPRFLQEQHGRAEVMHWIKTVAEENGLPASDLDGVTEILLQWIDQDRKHTALKGLQGMIWIDGYARAAFKAPVYEDADTALRRWHYAGIPLYIYSSGSVPAQKLFFAHTDHGDLCPLFTGYYDTEIGGKREAGSYGRIARSIGIAPENLLFLSDIVEELDAARDAGWQTMLVDRREDYPQARTGAAAHGHTRAERFSDISVL